MYVVYVLLSERGERTYVGQTNNFEKRLEYHNAGKVKSTEFHRPWKLVFREEFQTRHEAIKREKWFKSRTGRKRIAEILIQHQRRLERWPSG